MLQSGFMAIERIDYMGWQNSLIALQSYYQQIRADRRVMEGEDQVYFTEPEPAYVKDQLSAIKELNSLSLRHLRLKNKQVQNDIQLMSARIKYIRDRDEKVFAKGLSEEKRRSVLDTTRRWYFQSKQANEMLKRRREEQRIEMMARSSQEKFKRNSLRVFNAEMQKRQKVKMVNKLNSDMREISMQSQVLRETNQEEAKRSKQKLRKQELNSIAKKKIDGLVKKEESMQQTKLSKLRLEEGIRLKHELQIKLLIEKQRIATEKLEAMMKFRQDAEIQYFELTGYSRTNRSQTKMRLKTRKLSEQRDLKELRASRADASSKQQRIPLKLQMIETQPVQQQRTQVESKLSQYPPLSPVNKCDIFIS